MAFGQKFLWPAVLILLFLFFGSLFLVFKKPQKATPLPISPPPTSFPTLTPPLTEVPISVTLSGIVKRLEVSIYMQGTHYLEKEGRLLALLESQTLDLDNYLEKEVEVQGTAQPTVEGGKIIIKVNNIKILAKK